MKTKDYIKATEKLKNLKRAFRKELIRRDPANATTYMVCDGFAVVYIKESYES